jgi:hypothetical protein
MADELTQRQKRLKLLTAGHNIDKVAECTPEHQVELKYLAERTYKIADDIKEKDLKIWKGKKGAKSI